MRAVQSLLAFAALLCTALVVPVSAQSTAADWTQSDPPGDVAVYVAGTPVPAGLPAVRTVPYADITSFSIDDPHEVEFVFRLKNAAGFTKLDTPFVGGLEEIDHYIEFQMPRATSYAVIIVTSIVPQPSSANPTPSAQTIRVALCAAQNPASSPCMYSFYGMTLPFSVDGGELVIHVPKVFLTRDGPLSRMPDSRTWPAIVEPGDAITKISVSSSGSPPLFGPGAIIIAGGRPAGYGDRLPNTGDAPNYVLKFGMSAPDLHVYPQKVAVVAGEENIVPVFVSNEGGNKRLLNLSATYVDGTAKAPWRLSITPTVTVAGGKATNVTMRVFAPAGSAPGIERALVRITASILNEPGRKAVIDQVFLATPPLDKDHNSFYAHRGSMIFSTPFDPALDTAFVDSYINRLPVDPESKDETGKISASRNGGFISIGAQTSFRWYLGMYGFNGMRDAFPNPATLRKGEPITAHFDIESPLAMDGEVAFVLQVGDKGVLATGSKAISLKQGVNGVDLEAPMAGPVERLGVTGEALFARVDFRVSGPTATVYMMGTLSKNLYMVPKASFFKVPLDREFELVPRADLPQVGLTAAEDREAFINPGRQLVFEVDLRNEDKADQRVVLTVDNATQDWGLQVRPGVRFNLATNQSVHLGVIVEAPASMKEGDVLKFQVTARLADTNEILGFLKFGVVGTTGVQFENETFVVNEEDAKRLDTPHGSSPGLGVPLAILAVAGLVAFGRRRRA